MKVINNKYLLFSFVFTLLITGSYGQDRINGGDKRPNIIFITADQMRGDALGILGHPNVRTPQLDKMAKNGVLFPNFFSAASVCVPSRLSFYTGLLPHQHGTLTNKPHEFLHQMKGTMLGYFKSIGYQLGWIGKNHTYDESVLKRLNEHRIRSREPFRSYTKYVPPYWHGDTYWPNEELYATKDTRDAIDYINSAKKDQPFFLTLNYFDPHPPYFAPSEYAAHYNTENIKIPYYIPPKNLSNRLAEQQKALHYDRIKESDLKQTMKYYYASIEWVDNQVGQLIRALQSKGIENNTIVIFTSDHGDFMGEHHMVRKGMFLYDALVHIPFIVYGPGQIQKGIHSDVMASALDVFPTLIDLTDGDIPARLRGKLYGKSLLPVLKGDEMPQDHYTVFASEAYSDLPKGYFNNPEPPQYEPPKDNATPFHSRVEDLTWQPNKRTVMARTKNWKLILNESRPSELYKMSSGWIEKENVADRKEYQNIMKDLKNKIISIWNFWGNY